MASIPFNLDEVDLLLDLVYDFREDIEDGSIESPELQSLTVSTYDLISKLNSVKSSIFNGNDFEFLDMAKYNPQMTNFRIIVNAAQYK